MNNIIEGEVVSKVVESSQEAKVQGHPISGSHSDSPIMGNQQRINIDFPIEGVVGEVVTDPRLLEILNNAKPGGMGGGMNTDPRMQKMMEAFENPVQADKKEIKFKPSLENYRAILDASKINATTLKKFAWLLNNNPDPLCLAAKQEDLKEAVSPKILERTRDMDFWKQLKELGIYNVVIYEKEKTSWGYIIRTSGGQIHQIAIDREAYGRYVKFEEGIGLMLATYIMNFK